MSCVSETSTRSSVLRASALTLGRPGVVEPILRDIDFALAPGECVLLEGPTGSGKSTLLRAFAGLRAVELRGGALERCAPVTLLLQQVETQLLCTTVGEEVALGLQSKRLPEEVVNACVRHTLSRVGMEGSESFAVDTLSAGQKQRVVLAALLALEPQILLLDEPNSALDAEARRALARVLAELKGQGAAMLIADHAPDELGPIADRRVRIEQGRLCEIHRVQGFAGEAARRPPKRFALKRNATAGPVVLDANVDFEEQMPESAIRSSILPIRRGERLLLTGPNGAGKSSWLRALADRADELRSPAGSSHGKQPGGVALVIQNPRRSLFARSVADEVGFALRRQCFSAAATRDRVDELLARVDLLGLAECSPLRLSFGQQHRLAIVAALAAQPALMFLDEPFAGLDPDARDALLTLLEQEQAQSGTAFVLAAHDREPLAAWCDRVVELPSLRRAMHEVPAMPTRPLQFRAGHSSLHRLGAGWKLVLVMGIGALGLSLASLPLLIGLLLLVGSGYWWAKLPFVELLQDARWLLVQAAVVVLATLALRGADALTSGSRTALQLILFFLPVALMLRTTSSEALHGPLRRWLPDRLAFAFGVTLRLLPMFTREGAELVEMQRMRGARLGVRQLRQPNAWRDWLACIALPMTVRAIEVGEQVAEAAEIRGIGATDFVPSSVSPSVATEEARKAEEESR